jgi:hypothetical protein
MRRRQPSMAASTRALEPGRVIVAAIILRTIETRIRVRVIRP